MTTIEFEYRQQDVLGSLFNAQAVTTTIKSSAMDFGIPLGCPHSVVVINVGTLPTSKTITFKNYDSADNSSYSEIPSKLQLVTVTAGWHIILLNKHLVPRRYYKLEAVPNAFATGGTVTVNAFILPLTGLV